MRIVRAGTIAVTAATIIVGTSSCMNPRAEASIATQLNDAANEISGLKNDVAQMQTQIDSLRTLVQQQDSLINRIAAVNNIPR